MGMLGHHTDAANHCRVADASQRTIVLPVVKSACLPITSTQNPTLKHLSMMVCEAGPGGGGHLARLFSLYVLSLLVHIKVM